MVLVGQVGRDLVGLINRHSTAGGRACPERTAGCSPPTRRGALVDGEEVDLGLVGDVTTVRTEAVQGLIDAGRVPVVASIAPTSTGWCTTSTPTPPPPRSPSPCRPSGWLCSPTSRASTGTGPTATDTISELSASELRALMPSLESGMVPKMEACLRAVEGGLTRATVADGRVPHALLLEIFTNVGIGTMVTQDGLVRLGSRVFSKYEGIPPHEYANGEFQ